LVKCEKCDTKTNYQVDLTKVSVFVPEEHESKIILFEDVGVVMKYPSVDILEKIELLQEQQLVTDVIISCIDYIFDSDNIYHTKEQTKEEMEDFLNNLTQHQIIKINNFFETMPSLTESVNFTCKNCNHNNKYQLRGIQSFF
jgi:hypothetical protein